MTKDQRTNILHKAACIIGSALVTWGTTNPSSPYAPSASAVGALLVTWGGVKSHQLNADFGKPASPPQ